MQTDEQITIMVQDVDGGEPHEVELSGLPNHIAGMPRPEDIQPWEPEERLHRAPLWSQYAIEAIVGPRPVTLLPAHFQPGSYSYSQVATQNSRQYNITINLPKLDVLAHMRAAASALFHKLRMLLGL
jgi:hypothetical protein